jgi:YidC/Oxa1 family membrane protein insertase
MFSWLYKLLGTMLGWFSSIFGGSYALGLLLYALVFKILFLPFTIKQQKNQIKMAKLTPKIALIRAKYKGRTDRVTQQKMQQEIMELQQKEGASPLAGCLPMLIQLPLIIFLYNVIRKPLSYITKVSGTVILEAYKLINPETTITSAGAIDQIGFISQINSYLKTNINGAVNLENIGLDVSKIPDFTLFGINLADTPSLANFSVLVIIPVLAAVFQWFTMWVTRKVNGNNQLQAADAQSQMSMRMMDLVMPIMTIFFAFNFSGMLGLYWVYQSIISIIQTIILAKAMPIPKFTEEELKAIRKAEKEQAKAQREALKQQPKFRSLHYIDEDDYDELPEVKNSTANKDTNLNSSDAPEIKD